MPSNPEAPCTRFDQLVNGYRTAQIVFTANRLNLFQALAPGALSAAELSQALATDPRATRMLCDALAAIGLLEKDNASYRNSDMARQFLVASSPRAQNALLLHGAALYERWGKLYDVLKTGRPVPRETTDARLQGDEAAFARAMADAARFRAEETAKKLDLRGVRNLLDIGGGPGAYALACAKRSRSLKAVIMDSAATLEVAQQRIAEAGLADRVAVRAGNAFTDELGSGYDLILISNVIHSYSLGENERLVRRAAETLAPGGRLAVKDFLLQPSRVRPRSASLFAINMLVNTDGGDCYTLAEVKAWLHAAGLDRCRVVRLEPPSRMVVGTRP